MRELTALFAGLICLLGPSITHGRTWTDRTGKLQLEADLVDFYDGKVRLRRGDEPILVIDIDQFSQADQEYVRRELQRRRAALKAEVSDKPGTVLYGPGRQLGKLANRAVSESSGLACSRRTSGVFFTHNDSGDAARIYAFDGKGRDLGSCRIGDVQAWDFEDIASFRRDKKNYLLIGDIGNNGLGAPIQILYLIEEPAVDAQRGLTAKQVPIVQIIHLSYADDHRDCEGLAVDPLSRTILLVSKEKTSLCYVYALPWPENNPKKVEIARKIATLKIPPTTAMDISPDGRRAVVLTYADAYEYTRGESEDWATAFSRRPARIVLPERPQGESICYGPDGKTLYLTSEKLPTPLWEVPVKEGP